MSTNDELGTFLAPDGSPRDPLVSAMGENPLDAAPRPPWYIDVPRRLVIYRPLDLRYSIVFDRAKFAAGVIGFEDVRAVPLPSRSAYALPDAEVGKFGRQAIELYIELLWMQLEGYRSHERGLSPPTARENQTYLDEELIPTA